jgi:hypothetical protein
MRVSFSFSFLGWGEIESTWYDDNIFSLLYPSGVSDDECGAVGGMKIGR